MAKTWLDRIINRWAFPGIGEDRDNPCPGCDCCELESDDEELCQYCRDDIELKEEMRNPPEDKTNLMTWSKK